MCLPLSSFELHFPICLKFLWLLYSFYSYQIEKYSATNHKALLLKQKHSTNPNQIERQYKKDLGELMKLITPFTILNQKLNEMDFIRNAINSKEKSATERLHDDYRKMFKSDPCIMYCEKKSKY